jgi:two-component system alkaline phosphatase synthesis response regulator PhoP/two-component system response regulator RpaA
MTLIVAVDDDPDVLGTLGRVLEYEGFETKLAPGGAEALTILEDHKPDLLILDIIMPVMDGIEVCLKVRANPALISLPILFLTAKGSTDDVVEGLDAGADDYIVKPFEVAELRARVNALLRRAKRSEPETRSNHILQVRDLKLDTNAYCAYVEETPVSLTTTEYRLLRHLMENSNQTLTLGDLLQSVWDYPPDAGDPDLVRAHVRNLRRKLEKKSTQQYIRTVYGVGYIISTT